MMNTIFVCGFVLMQFPELSSSVKMGVLLPGAVYPNGNNTFPAMLLAVEELKSWNPPIEIELKVEYDNCDVPTSYDASHSLLTWGAEVIIGPTCTIVCGPVAHMAALYDVPVISYTCSGIELSDKETYPNFARTAESQAGAAIFLSKLFAKWDFKLYNIISTTQKIHLDIGIAFASDVGNLKDSDGEPFRLKQLKTVVSDLEEQDESVQAGTAQQLESFLNDAWVFFIPMYDADAYFVLKKAATKISQDTGVDVGEVWQKTNYAWFRIQCAVAADEQTYYQGIFSVENDRPAVTYKAEYDKFLEKFDDPDQLLEDESDSFPLYLAYSYNAVISWATAYKKAGSLKAGDIIAAMSNLKYQGAYRTELLDRNAEPANAIWTLQQFQGISFVEVAVEEQSGEITVYSNKIQWPNDEIVDPCKDDRCSIGEGDDTILYVVVGLCVFVVLVVMAVAIFIVRRNKLQNEADMKIPWKISFSELEFAVKKSLAGSRRLVQEEQITAKSSVAKYGQSYVVVKMLNCPNIVITKEILDDLYLLKKAVHPNLTLFHGLCDDPGSCAVVTEYCAKGPLKDIIHDDSVQLDWMFKLSLISDVAKGLRHLHQSNFGCHGGLTSSNCVVDGHWVCKLSDFGMGNILKETLDVDQAHTVFANIKVANVQDLFYAAPEMLWPSSKQRTSKEMQKCDTYSFSIVMYELFAREEPYDTSEYTPEKIIQKIRNRESPPFRPNLDLIQVTEMSSSELFEGEDSTGSTPSEAVKIMKQCWMEMPFERNNISETVQQLEDMNPDRMLSITDRVVKMMEKYSEDLEGRIAQKTQELEQKQTEKNLCSRYLPRQVIDRIEEGLEVESVPSSTITAVCIRIKILDSVLDSVAAYNNFEALNHREIENRDIYQVLDSNGVPMVVSGLYDEKDASQQILEYTRFLMGITKPSEMILKIVAFQGTASGGLLSTDSSNPRICISGPAVTDAELLLNTIRYGQLLLTEELEASSQNWPDVRFTPHETVSLSSNQSVKTLIADICPHSKSQV